MNNSLSNVD